MRCLSILTLFAFGAFAASASAADAPKRVLMVTHSGGFMHDSIFVGEQVLKELGKKNNWEVTCYRYTGDPDAKLKVKRKVDGKDVEVETTALQAYSEKFRERTGQVMGREHCGRINAETLKKFDAVLFFTTGSKRNDSPVADAELKDLMAWVRAGGAFVGTHCAADTLYDTPYGELVGAFFQTHPPGFQKVRIRVEDPKHPAAKGFSEGLLYEDEMYIFQQNPYSRDRLHIILSIHPDSFDPPKGKREDKDYAVSWCQQFGKGRSFYTSLGHRKEVWQDPRFQEHLVGGMKWAMGLVPGDATPSGRLKAGGE